MTEDDKQLGVTEAFAEGYRQLAEHFPQGEELDPELAQWLEESDFMGPVLKHPLVFVVPYLPQMAGYANKIFRQKREMLAEDEKNGDWSDYVWAHERPYRAWAFSQICHQLTDQEYWQTLRQVLIDTENFYQWADEIRDWLYDDDRAATRARYFMTDDERAQLDAMPDEFEIYRGYCMEGAEEGWSWTTNRALAEWFARRFDHRGEARVAVGTVWKPDVVGYLTDRNEDEIVVDPEDVVVTRIDVLGEVP